jgi:aldose 1-epimerase
MKITDRLFGSYEGESIYEYSLVNDLGMTVSCLNFGCVITKIIVPDRLGNFENVVLGFDEFEDYINVSHYFGAIVGRVAGRIKGAKFEIDGKEYSLTDNQFSNHLHGGKKGFSSVVWKCQKLEESDSIGLKFFYRSINGEEGYPGNIDMMVTYRLNNHNEFEITYEGTTDQKTLINLTSHSYFNLSGDLKRDCLDHVLHLESNCFLELDDQLIPTGKLIDSKNTVFNFQNGRKLIEGIISDHPQTILVGKGFDHPIVLKNQDTNKIELHDNISGRKLIVTTDQPCVILYTGNKLEGPYTISGVHAKNYLGVCLETQGFPDAIHHDHFPSIILDQNQLYQSKTSYRFLTIG